MTPTEDPTAIAWRRALAIALALPCPPDWALWASGRTAPRPYYPGASEADRWVRSPITAVPDPSDVAAYHADCRRRGVEPGAPPALNGDAGRGLTWHAALVGTVVFRVDGGVAAGRSTPPKRAGCLPPPTTLPGSRASWTPWTVPDDAPTAIAHDARGTCTAAARGARRRPGRRRAAWRRAPARVHAGAARHRQLAGTTTRAPSPAARAAASAA